MTKSLISVIVPVYNVEKFLPQCLDSLINQTYQNLEIICVNDGSVDSSLDILKKYQCRDSRIKIISKENGGLSSARNAGLKYAKGEFVSFIDSDDYAESILFETVMRYFSPDIDVVWFEYTERYSDGKKRDYHLNHCGRRKVDDYLLKTTDHTPWNKVYRASCLKTYNIQFPLGCLYEDIVFFWNLFSSSVNCVYFLKQSLLNYRINQNSIMGGTYKKKEGMSIYHIFILDHIYDFWVKNNLMTGREALFIWLCDKFFPYSIKYAPKWEVARCYWEMTSRLRKWKLPLKQGSLLKFVHDGEYEIDVHGLCDKNPKDQLKGMQKIFCFRMEGNKKVFRLLGFQVFRVHKGS